MMKMLLKKIKYLIFINQSVRFLILSVWKISLKLHNIFTIHWPVTGVFKVKLPKGEIFKIYSKGDDFIPTQVYWKGYSGYEYSIIPFYYLSKESNTIIDIGAHIGYYSIVASASNINSKIYAFEPVERIVNRFEKG